MLNINKDVTKYLIRPLVGIDIGNELRPVVLKDRLGFFVVNPKPASNDLLVDVIKPVLFEGAAFQAVVDLGLFGATKMKNTSHIELLTQDLGLIAVAGDAIQNEEIDIGLEATGLHHAVDLRRPKPDGNVVGNKLSFAGIVEESLAVIGPDIHRAKNIAASTMIKAGDCSENFALGSFAGTRGAKEKEGLINHDSCN